MSMKTILKQAAVVLGTLYVVLRVPQVRAFIGL